MITETPHHAVLAGPGLAGGPEDTGWGQISGDQLTALSLFLVLKEGTPEQRGGPAGGSGPWMANWSVCNFLIWGFML